MINWCEIDELIVHFTATHAHTHSTRIGTRHGTAWKLLARQLTRNERLPPNFCLFFLLSLSFQLLSQQNAFALPRDEIFFYFISVNNDAHLFAKDDFVPLVFVFFFFFFVNRQTHPNPNIRCCSTLSPISCVDSDDAVVAKISAHIFNENLMDLSKFRWIVVTKFHTKPHSNGNFHVFTTRFEHRETEWRRKKCWTCVLRNTTKNNETMRTHEISPSVSNIHFLRFASILRKALIHTRTTRTHCHIRPFVRKNDVMRSGRMDEWTSERASECGCVCVLVWTAATAVVETCSLPLVKEN